ncbi:MAG: hypothetical protein KAS47_04550 [Candidatus Heimdallarchaeota archaeon]|nr:hypothetical protein [Candidatus Heimdallarchaeota archaeon]
MLEIASFAKMNAERYEYDLMLLLSTLGSNKIRAILVLAHQYPKAVSATQLSMLLGYSLKARTIYRGILSDLQKRDLIFLDKLTPKVASIRLNHENPLLKRMIELAQKYGEKYLEVIDDILV